jgi:hypothetical protein
VRRLGAFPAIPGVLAASEVGPSLAKHRIDFAKSLETVLATLIGGTLARAAG